MLKGDKCRWKTEPKGRGGGPKRDSGVVGYTEKETKKK